MVTVGITSVQSNAFAKKMAHLQEYLQPEANPNSWDPGIAWGLGQHLARRHRQRGGAYGLQQQGFEPFDDPLNYDMTPDQGMRRYLARFSRFW